MVSDVTKRWSSHFFEEFPAEGLPLDCKPSSFVVRQAKSSPTELTLEDAVLLDQVIDDSLLIAVDPASYRNDQKFPRVYRSAHKGGF